MKTITVNGEARQTSAGDLPAFIAETGLAPETLLVEHNGRALLRSEWAATGLREGDRLEILRVSAGG